MFRARFRVFRHLRHCSLVVGRRLIMTTTLVSDSFLGCICDHRLGCICESATPLVRTLSPLLRQRSEHFAAADPYQVGSIRGVDGRSPKLQDVETGAHATGLASGSPGLTTDRSEEIKQQKSQIPKTHSVLALTVLTGYGLSPVKVKMGLVIIALCAKRA